MNIRMLAINKAQWANAIAALRLHPQQYPELIAQLQEILGGDWIKKLNLLGFEGNVNPERILPAVILFYIPAGFHGLILVALIAACMSSFDSTVNATTGNFTRDLYQRYLRI